MGAHRNGVCPPLTHPTPTPILTHNAKRRNELIHGRKNKNPTGVWVAVLLEERTMFLLLLRAQKIQGQDLQEVKKYGNQKVPLMKMMIHPLNHPENVCCLTQFSFDLTAFVFHSAKIVCFAIPPMNYLTKYYFGGRCQTGGRYCMR